MSIIANLSAKPDFDICIDEVPEVHELPEFKEIPICRAKASVKAAALPAALPTTSAELSAIVGFAPLPPVAAHKLGISTAEYNELERKLSKPKQWRPPAQRADAVERDMWRSAPGPTTFKWKEELKTLPENEKINTGEQLQDIILKNPRGHEVFLDNIRPYYDIDIPNLPGKTKADTKAYKAKWSEALCNTHAAIRAIWPHCTIHTFSSSGRTSEDTYKVSFHFIVSGAGYYNAGKGIPAIDVEGFDTQAYKEEGKRQCLRLPYAEAGKSDGKFPRFKQYVKIADDGPHATDLDDVCEEMADALQYWQYENWLPSFNKGEKLHHVENDKYAKQAEDVRLKRAPRAVGTAAEEAEKLAGLLAIIPNTAETDWGTWQAIIWGAKRHACDTECYAEGYAAVQAWSAKSPKYNETDTDNMWRSGKEDHPGGYTIGTLHYYAKLHNKAEYYNWVKSVTRKVTGVFSRKDPYCWYDFANQYEKSTWPSEAEMIKAVMVDAPRVIAYIRVKGGQFIQKINCKELVYEWVKATELGDEDFKLYYLKTRITPAKGKTPSSEAVERVECKISVLLKEHLHKFQCANSDFSLTPDPRVFNTYDGMQATVLHAPDLDLLAPLFKFLYVTVSDSNDEVYNYLINLLACSVQNPTKPVGRAIVLYGIQGTGKDTFVQFLRDYIFGEHLYIQFNSIPEATAQFNADQQGKKLFYISEASNTRECFMANYQIMKGKITADERNIEPKNVNRYKSKAADLWIVSTNNKYSIYLEGSDRRYFAFSMDPRTANDIGFFKQIRKDIFTQEIGDNFYTYLMQFAADETMLSKIPKTELRDAMMESSMTSVGRFVRDMGFILPTDPVEGVYIGTDVKSAVLFNKYCMWCSENRENATSAVKFGGEFSEYYKRVRKNTGFYYDTTKLLKQIW